MDVEHVISRMLRSSHLACVVPPVPNSLHEITCSFSQCSVNYQLTYDIMASNVGDRSNSELYD